MLGDLASASWRIMYQNVCTTTLMTYPSFPPHPQPAPPVAQVAQHVGPPPAQSSTAQPPLPCLGRLPVLLASCKPGRRASGATSHQPSVAPVLWLGGFDG